MDFIKKLSTWMDKIDVLDLEKKKMRREDRLGEIDYQALKNKHEEEPNRQQQKEVLGRKTLAISKRSGNDF
jgi:hypothetical protein